MKINSIIDLVKDLDTSRQTKNLNKLLIRILLHLQVEFSNKYPGRFTMLHIKDHRELGQSGMVGFDAIFNNAKTAGVENIVAEIEDYSCPVMESVKKSIDYLLEAPFVKASYSK